MNDTNPRISKRVSEMLKNRTAVDRLKMGAGMFDMARTIVASSLNAQGEKSLRIGLFMRFYGNEYSSSQKERIVKYLVKG